MFKNPRTEKKKSYAEYLHRHRQPCRAFFPAFQNDLLGRSASPGRPDVRGPLELGEYPTSMVLMVARFQMDNENMV